MQEIDFESRITRPATKEEAEKVIGFFVKELRAVLKGDENDAIDEYNRFKKENVIIYNEVKFEDGSVVKFFTSIHISGTKAKSSKSDKACYMADFFYATVQLCDNGELLYIEEEAEFMYPLSTIKEDEQKNEEIFK